MFKKISVVFFIIIVASFQLSAYHLVSTKKYRNFKFNIKALDTDKNYFDLSYSFSNKVTNDKNYNYYLIHFDELLTPREVLKVHNNVKTYMLTINDDGRVASFCRYKNNQCVLTIQFGSHSEIISIRRKIGNTLYEEKNKYDNSRRLLLEKHLLINGKLQEKRVMAYLKDSNYEETIIGPENVYLGTVKIEMENIDGYDLSLTNTVAYHKKNYSYYNGKNTLMYKETQIYTMDNRILFSIREGQGVVEYRYNEENLFSRQILYKRWQGNVSSTRDFYYFKEDRSKGLHSFKSKGLPLKAILRSDILPGIDKLKSHIFVYDKKMTPVENIETIWRKRGWRFDKEFISEHHYVMQFNASGFLIKKEVFNKQNQKIGFYDYTYDPHNNLVEERFLNSSDRIIKKVQYFYEDRSKKRKALPLTSYLKNYGVGGYFFNGNSLYHALLSEAKSKLENKAPAHLPKNKKKMLKHMKFIHDNSLKKIVFYDHHQQIVKYLRINSTRKKSNIVLHFDFYSKPVNFFYSQKKGWGYYEPSANTNLIYKPEKRDVYRDTVGRKKDFTENAIDSINPNGSVYKERKWKSYSFTLNKSFTTIQKVVARQYDHQWKTTQETTIQNKKVTVKKPILGFANVLDNYLMTIVDEKK